ncbi:Hmg Box-Containing Protein 1 [Manis pentadactyla]|nr:Hmg Box-Containing Protein 1 [Manis pentadactyla]
MFRPHPLAPKKRLRVALCGLIAERHERLRGDCWKRLAILEEGGTDMKLVTLSGSLYRLTRFLNSAFDRVTDGGC